MAISIPAIIDTEIAALRASVDPNLDAATNIAASSGKPMIDANRFADLLDLLMGLCDSGTLTVEGIHKVADATNPTSEADATDLTTAQTLLNALKTDANAHFVIVGANEHVGADVTNSIDAANATNQATAETLANEEKADINAHMALAAATGHYIADPDNVISAADATDLASLLVLANEIKAKYNAHIASINGVSTTQINDRTAFTTLGSLFGAVITFDAATTTTALQGVSATVLSHTASVLVVTPLPAIPVEADEFTLSFSIADADIAVLRQGRTTGGSGSNPGSSGPNMMNAVLKVLHQLGGTRNALDSGTTDGAGTNVQLVDSGLGATIGAYNDLWVFADDAGTLDVDNLRRITTNSATEVNVRNAFLNVAGTPTVPGASTALEVRTHQIYSGTAAAGAASSITCPATISFALNELAGLEVVITSGTGIGQRRSVASNTAGVSSVITVSEDWATNPDGTSVFELQFEVTPDYVRGAAGIAAAEPFGFGSPHGGGAGNRGHESARLMGALLERVRDVVAGYTVPT
jgi:hypothetical protein